MRQPDVGHGAAPRVGRSGQDVGEIGGGNGVPDEEIFVFIAEIVGEEVAEAVRSQWRIRMADRSACPTVHIIEGDCSAAVAAVARRHAAIPENNVFLMVWVCWLIKCSYNFGVK